jgi:hypothetical protein
MMFNILKESRILLLGGGTFHGRINRLPEQMLLKSEALLCFAVLCFALKLDA